MPNVIKTVFPRIRKSIRDHGIARSLRRSFLLPIHLLTEYRAARKLRPDTAYCEFDVTHGVDTEGEFGGWTYLSDLKIPSPNWIEGNDYLAIEPERFKRVLNGLEIRFEDYIFIDFGSGMGRALLLASEYSFKKIIGLEFSSALHQRAEENIRRYRSDCQLCRDIRSINVDFLNFVLPVEPLVLFFFDPCQPPLIRKQVERLRQSLIDSPRSVYVAYVAPKAETERLFKSCGFLLETFRSTEFDFLVYAAMTTYV
jgi:SAM-dependent methyltransferase